MEKGFYPVGGQVRDIAMGMIPKDNDYVAVGYTIEEMISLGFNKVGADFPVFLHPETKDEYALPRTERSTGKGYHDFEINTDNVSLKEDLYRRDLTINAMALMPDGSIYDPHNGLKDLNNKVLRHTSEAFFEDPVRVLRIARFTARFTDFKIADETVTLIKSMKNAVADMTKERIWKETQKALSESSPQNYFRALLELDVLDVVFPEIFKMIGTEQNPKYHAEGDVFEHTMLVLQETSKISKDPIVRFASLFHDIGKAEVFKENGNLHGHDNEELVVDLLEKVKNRYKVPNDFMSLAKSVTVLHHRIYRFDEMKDTSIVKTFENKYFPKTEEELIKMIHAINGDTFGRVLGDGDILSKEDVELLFGYKVTSLIKGTKLFVPGSVIRKDFVDEVFIVKAFHKLKKVSPAKFIEEYKLKNEKNPSVDKIKEFIYREKIRVIASMR